jgi:hypothetical protein
MFLTEWHTNDYKICPYCKFPVQDSNVYGAQNVSEHITHNLNCPFDTLSPAHYSFIVQLQNLGYDLDVELTHEATARNIYYSCRVYNPTSNGHEYINLLFCNVFKHTPLLRHIFGTTRTKSDLNTPIYPAPFATVVQIPFNLLNNKVIYDCTREIVTWSRIQKGLFASFNLHMLHYIHMTEQRLHAVRYELITPNLTVEDLFRMPVDERGLLYVADTT